MGRHNLAIRCALATLSLVVALNLGRLFAGDRWLAPLVLAALVPHLIGLVCDRIRVPSILLFALSLLGLACAMTWIAAGSSTWFGVPTGRSFSLTLDAIRAGATALRSAVPPVPTSPALIVIAVPVVWVAAMNADFLALRADAPIGALTFPTAVLVLTTVFDRSAGSLLGAGAFVLAAACYLAMVGTDRLEKRRAWLHAPAAASRARFALGGLAIAMIAVATALVIGPLAPGADGRAVIDLSNGGDDRGDVSTDNPLVGLKGQLDQRPAATLFTVAADRPQYWRLTALDRFNGNEWSLDTPNLEGARAAEELTRANDTTRPSLRQTFQLERLSGQFVPAAFSATAIRGIDGVSVAEGIGALIRPASNGAIEYEVESRLAPADLSASAQAASAGSIPPSIARNTQLPASFPARVRDLAAQKTSGAANRYEQAKRLEDWFARSGEFTYSLSTRNGSGQSAIEEFVFTGKQGFCEQFAAAYAAMARAVGVPARVVVGFTPGTANADRTGFTVQTRDAHAWAEVWISDAVGWMPMEPTPAGSQPGQPPSGDNPDTPAPSPTTAAPTTVAPTTTTANPASSTTAPSSTTGSTAPRPRSGETDAPFPWPLVGSVLGAVALIGLALMFVRQAPARRRRRRAAGSPDDAVRGAWVEALDVLRATGFEPRRSLTPTEIAAQATAPADTVRSTALATLAQVYTVAQFSPRPTTDEDAQTAWAAVTALDADVAPAISARDRWRARVLALRPERITRS